VTLSQPLMTPPRIISESLAWLTRIILWIVTRPLDPFAISCILVVVAIALSFATALCILDIPNPSHWVIEPLPRPAQCQSECVCLRLIYVCPPVSSYCKNVWCVRIKRNYLAFFTYDYCFCSPFLAIRRKIGDARIPISCVRASGNRSGRTVSQSRIVGQRQGARGYCHDCIIAIILLSSKLDCLNFGQTFAPSNVQSRNIETRTDSRFTSSTQELPVFLEPKSRKFETRSGGGEFLRNDHGQIFFAGVGF